MCFLKLLSWRNCNNVDIFGKHWFWNHHFIAILPQGSHEEENIFPKKLNLESVDSRPGNVALLNYEMEIGIYVELLLKINLTSLTWKCRLKVLPRRNSYDKLNIFETHNFLNMIFWLCQLRVLLLACDNIDIFNIFQYI